MRGPMPMLPMPAGLPGAPAEGMGAMPQPQMSMPMEGMLGADVLPFPQPEPEPLTPEQEALAKARAELERLAEMVNVADEMDAVRLSDIGKLVVREYGIDHDSRQDWETRARRAMDLAKQKKEAKSFPWKDASNVKYPLLTTAALQFAARAYPAICDGQRIVKVDVKGADPDGIKAAAADRVSQHMSYQLLQEVDGWESDVDTMLHQIPIIGCAFKKVYEDGSKEAGFCDELVSAFDLVVNQKTKTLRTVPRATHVFTLYPHEIRERQRAGRFIDMDIRGDAEDNTDDDAPHDILEQHRYLDLDDDGIEEPWIVTVHKRTERVLRIVACYDPKSIEVNERRGKIIKIPRRQYFVKVPFVPDPDGGFYDLGFGHLLEPLSDVIDTAINQMMDAGTIQNAGGGFIGAGVQLGKGKSVITFKPGEYRTVQSSGPDLRASIVNMQHPGPSTVLFQLLGMIVEAAKDVAGIQDILVGDQQKVQTATTTLAMIEQGLKVFTAIYKRIFRALKEEFALIFEINKRSLVVPKYVSLLDEPINVVAQDYMGDMDVVPIADPNSVTDMQRIGKAQLVLEEAKGGNPAVNVFAATRRAFEAARIDKPEEVLVPEPDPNAPKEPTPEEKAAELDMAAKQADIEAKQAQAQIKAQGDAAALEAKNQELMLKLAAAERDFERKQAEADLKFEAQVRQLQLKSDEMDQKWQALQLKEAEMKAAHAAKKEAMSGTND